MRDAPLVVDPRAVERAASAAWLPVIHRRAVPSESAALDDLVASGAALFVHDALHQQLEDLLDTRSPEERLPPSEVARRARAHAGADPSYYGAWVYYPWSGRLVHVLPEAEYEELRTSRNRNKITRDEQTRLGRLRVGVTGLSVGRATVATLALEGVGGEFRLADFDTLSLSNMNRLRVGVHDIGVNKAILAAREVFENNPYARVRVFEQGIRRETLESFFTDGGPLDLLVEECDDLEMKFRLRLEARRRGVPVLMETSDRGMVDVERFDREPERPLFHGLVPEVDPGRLSTMTRQEKVGLVLDILGADTISRRLAASLVDVDATLRTWPQLASAIALGGALNTEAARRIALGRFTKSGRFFVDIEALVGDQAAAASGARSESQPTEDRAPASDDGPPTLPRLASSANVTGPLAPERVRELVRLATLAPSGGNCQPWSFTYRGGVLRARHDEARSRSLLDYAHLATYAAFGALAENLRLAAGTLGLRAAVRPFPDGSDPTLVFEACLESSATVPDAEDAALAAQIELRATNRSTGRRGDLRPEHLRALNDAAIRAGGALYVARDDAALRELGDVLGEGDRVRFCSPVMHAEMMRELRWSADDAVKTRDGLDVRTLDLSPSDRTALRLVSDWSVIAAVREVGGGAGLARSAKTLVAGASAVGLLVAPGATRSDAGARDAYFRGGAAMQRVWLTATQLGLGFHPMTALVYMAARLERGGGDGFDEGERSAIAALCARYRAALGTAGAPGAEILLFRLTAAPPPGVRSMRRDVGDLLTIDP